MLAHEPRGWHPNLSFVNSKRLTAGAGQSWFRVRAEVKHAPRCYVANAFFSFSFSNLRSTAFVVGTAAQRLPFRRQAGAYANLALRRCARRPRNLDCDAQWTRVDGGLATTQ